MKISGINRQSVLDYTGCSGNMKRYGDVAFIIVNIG